MHSSSKASKQPNPGAPAQALTPQENERLRLERHLQAPVNADPKAARKAMEMSQEQAPELFQIAQDDPPSQWGQSLTNSDSMNSLLSRAQKQHKVLLSKTDLRSLLEQLP